MSSNPEIMKKLLEIFRQELDEQLQSITNNLIKLEKNNLSSTENDNIIESIFRSAHNIKGAARGVGVQDIGNIAHHIENLFSAMQKKTLTVSKTIIDLCLEAIDNMRAAMDSFTYHKPLPFDLNDILSRLSQGESSSTIPTSMENTKKTVTTEKKSKIIIEPEEKNAEDVSKEHETIRVSIDSLDRISALMEEIQVSKISIEDHYINFSKLGNKIKQFEHAWKQIGYHINSKELSETVKKLYHSNHDNILEISSGAQQTQKNIKQTINELTILSDSLQEELRMLRLIPASVLLNTLPRIVRDISNNLGKKIELIITGDSVKIDKLILEGLQNPLIHLLRNAIDHGIESPEIRRKLGKSEIGKIKIDVQDEGGHILITFSDDGGGIDVKQIALMAERKNMFSKSILDTMSESAILNLIFSPGFSTKEIITEVSGRGVGLDVVKSNIVNLKGEVNVSTHLGIGTTFSLKLPLTLASERGLMVKCSDQLFVIPTSKIERVLLLKSNTIVALETSQVIILDKHPIPLKCLADVVGIPSKDFSADPTLSVLVIRNENESVALIVDEIIGEREIIIKPLSAPLSHIPSVAGGTLAGNGQAILVLNINNLIKTALNLRQESQITKQDTLEKPATRTRILVVDDSITTRTLEKNILESKNYDVTIAVNGKEAWDLLQKHKFSLLITDVNMPIMDGFSLTENVKKSEKLHELPVIIVTALESDAEKKRGIEVGANAYLVKSQFESETLLEIVQQLV